MTKITEDHREILRKKALPTWATIIPARTTKDVVTLHNQRSHAFNAVKQSRPAGSTARYDDSKGGRPTAECEIYERVGDEWVLRWQVAEGTYPNDLPWRIE